MRGGVANSHSLPDAFLKDMYAIGVRPWHYRGFISIIRNMFAWNDAHDAYGRIRVPVLLIYGDQDWSHKEDRIATHQAIPHSRMETVPDAGHFLTMDQPQALLTHIRDFVGGSVLSEKKNSGAH